MKEKIQIWIPFAFCSYIFFMSLLGENGGQIPSSLAFLPMCFFFVAMPMMKMKKEIEELKSKLEKNRNN